MDAKFCQVGDARKRGDGWEVFDEGSVVIKTFKPFPRSSPIAVFDNVPDVFAQLVDGVVGPVERHSPNSFCIMPNTSLLE